MEPNFEMHRLSNFIDRFPKEIVTQTEHPVRDDLDLLNYLRKHVNRDTVIISYGVEKLDTMITHQYGLEAIVFWLRQIP